MQEEFYKNLEIYLSNERLSSYGIMDNADNCTVLARYLWNMALCESLYSPLQICEVGLRNSLHNRLKCLYTDRWYDNPAVFLMTNWGTEEVIKAREKIAKMGNKETPGKVVAELKFGFWTHLFEDHYERNTRLLPRSIRYIFPHLPTIEHNRKKIKFTLEEIRDLRNRVFHHERIIHWKDLDKKHNTILEVINWVSPQLCEMAINLDRFKAIHKDGIDPWKIKIRHHWPKSI